MSTEIKTKEVTKFSFGQVGNRGLPGCLMVIVGFICFLIPVIGPFVGIIFILIGGGIMFIGPIIDLFGVRSKEKVLEGLCPNCGNLISPLWYVVSKITTVYQRKIFQCCPTCKKQILAWKGKLYTEEEAIRDEIFKGQCPSCGKIVSRTPVAPQYEYSICPECGKKMMVSTHQRFLNEEEWNAPSGYSAGDEFISYDRGKP